MSSSALSDSSLDVEIMKNVGRLQNRVHALSSEISDVIRLRNDVMKRDQPLMDKKWHHNLKAREAETIALQNKFNETRRGGGTNVMKAFRKLYKKVTVCLQAVVGLKREAHRTIVALKVADLDGSLLHNGDGISRSFQSVLTHLANGKPIPFSSDELRTYTNGFSTRLGSGGFGVVYKGEFPNGVNFAVKLLHRELKDNVASKQFLAEVGTMGRTYHRNLLRIYGYCSDKSMKAIVYEYMPNRSLAEVLRNNHLNLEWEQIYIIVTDTARGISYLHDNCHKCIIHLDIKPANVLIDSDLCPKVADFGLARHYNRDLSHVTLTGFKGTCGYAAPELWSDMPLPGTCKCDVYSYGMLLLKFLQRKKNCNIRLGGDEKPFPVEVWEKYTKGQLEGIWRDCCIEEKDRENATKLVLVAFCCIQKNPRNRPSMSTVVKTLEGEIEAKLPPNLVLPQMFSSSGVASMVLAEKNMLSSAFSSLSTRAGDSTTEAESNFLESWVSSETSPSSAERMHGELQYPVQKRMVEINKKNQEKKDIKPEVKKDEVTTVVLKVSMHCEDCALKIKKTLMKMEGVVSADPDLGNSLVTVKCFIEPNKLVEEIKKKHKKHADIVKPELGKKQEEKGVEHYRIKEKEDKKEEGLAFAKTKSKMKREKQLDTVKTKSEAKGVVEEGETKLKKKKEENLGTMERKSEKKGVAEMKLKKEEEEMETAKTVLEKEKAKAKAERKRKGKEKIEEEKDMWEKKTKEEEDEENGNMTVKNSGVEKKMPTWARPEEEISIWRGLTEMQNAYNLPIFSDENSNSWGCSIQ